MNSITEDILVPREPTVVEVKAIKDMTKKERREFMRERIADVISEKRGAKIRHEVLMSDDALMIRLRERMLMDGNIKYAEVVDEMRQKKMVQQGKIKK